MPKIIELPGNAPRAIEARSCNIMGGIGFLRTTPYRYSTSIPPSSYSLVLHWSDLPDRDTSQSIASFPVMISNKARNFNPGFPLLHFCCLENRTSQCMQLHLPVFFFPLRNATSEFVSTERDMIFSPNCTTISASRGLWREVSREGGL